MAKCVKCGKGIASNEKFCSYCGTINESYIDPISTSATAITAESSIIGVLAIVFGFISPIIGFILSIIGLRRYHTQSNLVKCKIGLGVSIGMFVLEFILGFILGSILGSSGIA